MSQGRLELVLLSLCLFLPDCSLLSNGCLLSLSPPTSRSVTGLDKEPDLVHMEAQTADGRECLQPTLKKWALSQERSGNGNSLNFVSPFTFQLIGKMWVMWFDVRHILILSPWGEIQRLQGLCLWRGWAEAQSVGLRSRLFCSLFICLSIMYFT